MPLRLVLSPPPLPLLLVSTDLFLHLFLRPLTANSTVDCRGEVPSVDEMGSVADAETGSGFVVVADWLLHSLLEEFIVWLLVEGAAEEGDVELVMSTFDVDLTCCLGALARRLVASYVTRLSAVQAISPFLHCVPFLGSTVCNDIGGGLFTLTSVRWSSLISGL